MLRHVLRFIAVTGAIVAAACVENAPISPASNTITASTNSSSSPQLSSVLNSAQSYIIDFTGNSLPADLDAQVASAGGVVTSRLEQLGLAIATTEDPQFRSRAEKMRGVFSVEPDLMLQWVQPERVVEAGAGSPDVPAEPAATFGSTESLRRAQWVPDAIHAPEAWDLGARGAGARVAVIDGGIYNAHLDIAPRLDVAHSRSFVPGQPFNFDQARDAQGVCRLNDTFWHGTHVAGIVAAPGNNIGTVGIAPDATIIGVKALHCGSGSFSWILNAIVYAATPISEGGAGAVIINMSLGATLQHQQYDPLTGKPLGASGAAHLLAVIGKVTTYAYQRGVTVVAALGNSALDLDHTNDVVFVPAMSPHVIAVSALGPVGFALGATNFDRLASYSNYGQSAVDFAAGGGDFALPGNAFCSIPRNPPSAPPIVTNCWVFDMVLAPCRSTGTLVDRYCFAAGTSMASPAVAGVAALIIGKFGRVGPAEVERRLRQSADDLGKPGNDDVYGGGRVNALRAIQ